METQNRIEIQLSHEEILYLISLLKTGTLPGLGENPLEAYPENERDIMLRSGFNSLQARGLVQYQAETKTVTLDSVLLALFSTCAMPRKTLFFSRIPVHSAPVAIYFHEKDRLFVSHRAVPGLIHIFNGLFEHQAVQEAIFAELTFENGTDSTFPDIQTTSNRFDGLLELLLQEKREEAKTLCIESGLAPRVAESLIESLDSMTANATLLATWFETDRSVKSGSMVAWIENPKGSVRIETVKEGGQELIHLSALAISDVKNQALAWIIS